MTRRIGVALVHGVEVADPEFAVTAAAKLQRAFARECGDAELVFEPVHWAPVLEAQELELMRRLWGEDRSGLFATLRDLIRHVNRGYELALAPLILSGLVPAPRLLRRLNFATLRWMLVHFVGDALAYQRSWDDRRIYDEIHAVFARSLAGLAGRAGPEAPLCVVAHSLGSVIACDHLRDLRAASARGEARRASPFERGETLAGLYTLGSPIALWSLRHRDFGTPVRLPRGEWLNFFDRDDVIGSPLQLLNEHYQKAVTRDVEVSLGGLLSGWNPLAHTGYWSDDGVMRQIARSMATL